MHSVTILQHGQQSSIYSLEKNVQNAVIDQGFNRIKKKKKKLNMK